MKRKKNTKDMPVKITAGNGLIIEPSEKCFYVNSSCSGQDGDYQFSNLHSAVEHAIDGTADQPMSIYIEPDVYQMNGTEESPGLIIDKDYITLIGLTDNPSTVVLADNRGYGIGSDSLNIHAKTDTVHITGTGFRAENITFGNYCNCDLEYPLDSSKSQKKRSATISQASCIGTPKTKKDLDKFVFKNVRFISMLHTLAFEQVMRVYYENCYILGSENSIGGDIISVQKDCTLYCYGNNPINYSGEEGMAFINCTWNIDFKDHDDLMLTGHSSTLYMADCKFNDLNGTLNNIFWTKYPQDNLKCCYYSVTKDNLPYEILPSDYGIRLDDLQVKSINSYALLRNHDDWDPAGTKLSNSSYNNYPVHINISESKELALGENTCKVTANIFPVSAGNDIVWSCDSEYADIKPLENESERVGVVNVTGNNSTDDYQKVKVTAKASNGIFNYCYINIPPSILPSPTMTKSPTMRITGGLIQLDYELDLNGYEDESIITWYYINNTNNGNILAETAVTRLEKPNKSYRLTYGDIGKYIIAAIEPKHRRSKAGKLVNITSPRIIEMQDVHEIGIQKYNYYTDFIDFPTAWNSNCINGGWIIDSYKPLDQPKIKCAATDSPWTYASGINGASDKKGLMTTGFGARLIYKVSMNKLKLMTAKTSFESLISLSLNPERTDGQGFYEPKGQYFEVYIKYDSETLTGYGLRIERTTEYSYATRFTLYQYKDGLGSPISEGVYSSAFNSECNIKLWTSHGSLYARISTTAKQNYYQKESDLPTKVRIYTAIEENYFYDVGLQHTGTIMYGNLLQLTKMDIQYH